MILIILAIFPLSILISHALTCFIIYDKTGMSLIFFNRADKLSSTASFSFQTSRIVQDLTIVAFQI